MSPPPDFIVRLLFLSRSSVTPEFIVKTTPGSIVIEVPDGIVRSKPKVISTVIMQGSNPFPEIVPL